jgi:hypothetical protein
MPKPASGRGQDDLSSWPVKSAVSSSLGISEKSVERWVQRGELEQRMRAERGRRSVAVYNPAHVAALAAKLRLDRGAVAVLPPELVRDRVPALPVDDRLGGMVAKLVELLGARVIDPPARLTVYVSLPEAAAITGLAAATIQDLAARLQIRTMPYGRGVRYRRADLEAL